jgi:hypothetical protein
MVNPSRPHLHLILVLLAGLVGLVLMADEALVNSATYDEVAYLRVAARWWRTGDQEPITRMGSPLTFWKLQQAPVLWALDRGGFGRLIDDPIAHQAALLPLARIGSLWIWAVAWGLTACWSRLLYGPRAMVLASWLFATGPNLLAHGSLITMELPLVACAAGMFLLFWLFLETGRSWFFWASAALGGLAFSCKFTTALFPLLLGLAWWVELWRRGQREIGRMTLRVGLGMAAFLLVLILSNLLVTGCATLPLSPRTGAHPSLDGRFGGGWDRLARRIVETPIPQDWVGFATQIRHQRSGGPSYLFGERRLAGWWYYYFVALAVKVPLAFWLLVAARTIFETSLLGQSFFRFFCLSGRAGVGRRSRDPHERIDPNQSRGAILPLVILAFLAVTALGSSRNYGVRYLLPLAPLAIVWVSALAEGPRGAQRLAIAGLVGQALAVALVHPHELSYFNLLAGGPRGGRRVLADSNLDWGQGAKTLARLQRQRPEFQDLTLYYFGDTDPGHYGVLGRRVVIDASDDHPDLPLTLEAHTTYIAVSTSLQYGPWGPPGYFRRLDGIEPAAVLADGTISIYRTGDLAKRRAARE